MFLPGAADPGAQEMRGRLAQYHFPVLANMIAVRMADEDLFRTRLWFMRVEPEPEFRKMDSAAIILERQCRHRNNLSVLAQLGGPKLTTSPLAPPKMRTVRPIYRSRMECRGRNPGKWQ